MSRILIVVLALFLMAPAASADPRSEEDRGRSEEADDRSERQEHASNDPEQEDEASEEGADEGSAEPSDRPEAEPSSSPTPRPSGSPEPQQPRAAAASDALDATFTASPAHIAPGEDSTLTVEVSNAGGETIHSLDLMAELPDTLELVSSDPDGSGDRDLLWIAFGSVPAGTSVRAELTVIGVAGSGPQLPVRFALIADGRTFRHELTVVVDPSDPEGELDLSQSGPLLVQVGDVEGFSMIVSNPTDALLSDVAVLAEIAPELDVVGVVPVADADAIQLGSSASSEDIVWIFHELGPGESVELSWTARVVSPGDLEATSSVSGAVGGRRVTHSEQRTYLGFVEALEVERNEASEPVVRRKVVTKMVPVTREVAASAAALLPVTGTSPTAVLGMAVILIALGFACVGLSGRGPSVRRVGTIALSALLLTFAACVSSPEQPTASPGEVSGGSALERRAGVEEMPEPEDEVLGVRIEKDQPLPGDSGVRDDPATPTSPAEVGSTSSDTALEEISVVQSVLLPASDLPVRSMPTRSGDNTMSIAWAPPEDLTATSSRILSAEALDELVVSIRASGSRLTATVRLTNLAEGQRLAVRGTFGLEVAEGGASSTLRSEPVDVVLEPGASIESHFIFSLPAGVFTGAASFLSE